MTYKFEVEGLPDYWANERGLKFRQYNIYPTDVSGAPYGSASPNPYGLSSSAATGPSGSVTSVDRSIVSSATTLVYRGYFKPDQTSASWQFRTTSNDGSWFWIDNDATGSTTDLNVNNAIVKNGGFHTVQTVASSNLTLSQSAENDLFYAVALVAGNDPGGGSIRLQFRRDGGSWQTDGDGFYFHDSRRDNGFRPGS